MFFFFFQVSGSMDDIVPDRCQISGLLSEALQTMTVEQDFLF